MTPAMEEKIKRHRKALYLTMKQERPDLYELAIRVGHMALSNFGGHDETKRAATVEISAMELAAKAAGIKVNP